MISICHIYILFKLNRSSSVLFLVVQTLKQSLSSSDRNKLANPKKLVLYNIFKVFYQLLLKMWSQRACDAKVSFAISLLSTNASRVRTKHSIA